MTETDAGRFRREAQEQQAEKTISPLDWQLLRMVNEWTRAAKDAEQRRQPS
jgi:hypothetical protein